jgi:pimeloyl-ACP methyl ester carboxylesterase
MGAVLEPRPFFTDDGQGEPVVLLHAFPLDGRMWEAQRADLARGGAPQAAPTSSRFRVIVHDLAGFGRSADVTARATLDAHAGDIALLLDTLAIERATLVGLSMGGYIALAFARQYPERLARLGLADTRAAADSLEAKAGRDENMALVAREGVAALVERMLPKLLSARASSDVVSLVRSLGNSQPSPAVQAALAAMRDRADSNPVLARLDVPTAVIAGEADSIIPLAEARAMTAEVAHAELTVVARAGHLANLESPAVFTSAIRRLMQRAR